jgi:hypothetical protein
MGIGATFAVVLDGEAHATGVVDELDDYVVGPAVLGRVGDGLEHDEPGAGLEIVIEPGRWAADLELGGAARREVVEGGAQPAVGQHRRVKAVGQIAQLQEDGVALGHAVTGAGAQPIRIAVEQCRLELEGQRQ